MNQLKHPLRANGSFSLLSGILLTLAPGTVSNWLSLDAPLLIRLFGVVLLGHALLLFWGAVQPNPRLFTTMNFFAIAPYPLGMIALVASGIIESALGRTLVLVDGAIIAAIALWHWRALQTHRHSPAPLPA